MGCAVSVYLDDARLAKLDRLVATCADKDRANGLKGHAVTSRSSLLAQAIDAYLASQPVSSLTPESIRYVVEPLAKSFGAKRVSLFGSCARGETNEDSDIDILLDKGDIRGLQVLDFQDALQNALNRKVDVITTAGADARFLKRIAKDAVVLYDAS